jgi:ethanolamine transporter EutH
MNESGKKQPPTFRLSRLFWVGVLILAVGSGPLLVTILLAALGLTKDPNPNPVGFGILAFLMFWPSVALIVGGLVASISQYRSARKRFYD